MLALVLNGCASDETEKKADEQTVKNGTVLKQNLNVSILLDLSDRIDPLKHPNPSMEFYRRDLGYIESISGAFERHLRTKPVVKINDQIQVYFEPEPLDAEINNLAKELRLSFTKANATKAGIEKVSPQFTSVATKIYEQAIQDKKYIGSDIWSFFKNKVKDYCIKTDHRNILFILTDGYMFHQDSKFMEDNKSSYLTPELVKALKLNTSQYNDMINEKGYGFVKANDNLDDLEVVVLGINPAKGNPFEGDVISAYWEKWFADMKIENYVIKPADLPSNLDDIIQTYISK